VWKKVGMSATSGPSPAKVLLVDDEPANRLALRAVLEGLDLTLVEAQSGEEALRRLRESPFAVVLLDVQMPGLDGFETAKLIRSRDGTRHIPIIFQTAYEADRATVERAYSLGAVDFLVKPLLPVVLRAKVTGFVELFRQRRQVEERTAELRASEERFRLLVDGTADHAIYMLDPTGRVVSWNPGAERIKQYRADEIIGRHFSCFFSAEDVEDGKPQRELELATAERKYEEEGWRVRKDGTRFWARAVITALRDDAGHLRGFSKVTRDITRRKQAEENARRLLEEEAARRAAEEYAHLIEAQREQLRVTLTSIGDGVITTDAGGRVTLLNPVAESLMGWTTEAAAGLPLETVFRIVSEVTRQPVENPVAGVIATGQIVGLANHTILIARDGTERPIDDSAAPIRDRHGRVVGVVLVFRDVAARRRAEIELHEAVQQLKIVTDAMSVPVTRCSRDLHYVWVSKAYGEWIGRQPGEIAGRPIIDIMGEEAFARLLPRFRQVLSGEVVRYEEEVNYRELGRRWISAVYTPTVDAAGVTDGWVAVVIDTTERKRLEGALRDADRRKNEFLATLAHELRNPLAPIRNAVEILNASGTSDPALRWGRDVIDRQVRHMARLLDDLLDVSRISHGKMELRKERVELAAVVRNAVETSRPVAEGSGHELAVALPPAPIYLDADPVRLAQVFSNLLNNAARYTEAGGHIRLAVERQGSDVLVSVRDDGIGIAAEALPRIFEMFAQATPALERSQSGLGIGLALVKGVVELHGGRVEARSGGPGRGSEFTVRLPVLIEKRVEDAPPGDEDEPPCVAQCRILIVDDLKDSADSLAMLLRMAGHEVHTAYDGEEAVSAAEKFRPEVVLLDIGMPRLNGYDACRRIRERPWGEGVYLIAVTGWGQDDDRRRTEEAGFNGHMVKPVNPRDLMKVLAGLQATAE
jgi:PAS domain S-box-containing protein